MTRPSEERKERDIGGSSFPPFPFLKRNPSFEWAPFRPSRSVSCGEGKREIEEEEEEERDVSTTRKSLGGEKK